jgi:hypothetical protein
LAPLAERELSPQVGEGLFWDADDGLLRFLDIPGKKQGC